MYRESAYVWRLQRFIEKTFFSLAWIEREDLKQKKKTNARLHSCLSFLNCSVFEKT